jgi:hypothetical protein
LFLGHADLVRHGRLRWGKIPSVRLANPPVPLAGFYTPLPGQLWVPADTETNSIFNWGRKDSHEIGSCLETQLWFAALAVIQHR